MVSQHTVHRRVVLLERRSGAAGVVMCRRDRCVPPVRRTHALLLLLAMHHVRLLGERFDVLVRVVMMVRVVHPGDAPRIRARLQAHPRVRRRQGHRMAVRRRRAGHLVMVVVVMLRQVLHLTGVGRRSRRRVGMVTTNDIHADDTTSVQIRSNRTTGRQIRGGRHALVGAPSRRVDTVRTCCHKTCTLFQYALMRYAYRSVHMTTQYTLLH